MLTPSETRAPEARPVRLQLSRKKGFDLQAAWAESQPENVFWSFLDAASVSEFCSTFEEGGTGPAFHPLYFVMAANNHLFIVRICSSDGRASDDVHKEKQRSLLCLGGRRACAQYAFREANISQISSHAAAMDNNLVEGVSGNTRPFRLYYLNSFEIDRTSIIINNVERNVRSRGVHLTSAIFNPYIRVYVAKCNRNLFAANDYLTLNCIPSNLGGYKRHYSSERCLIPVQPKLSTAKNPRIKWPAAFVFGKSQTGIFPLEASIARSAVVPPITASPTSHQVPLLICSALLREVIARR